MPIINNRLNQKVKVKVELTAETLKQIEDYCAWARINELSAFIEEAANFVFYKDKDWKQKKRMDKRAAKRRAKRNA